MAVRRIDRKLDVAPSGLDADLADDSEGGVAHPLVFLVCQRLSGSDGDRVPRVDAHRIEILDRADNDDVIGTVAHHLELELFPADDRLLDQDLSNRAEIESAGDELIEFVAVVGDATAGAAKRETRPQHAGKPDLVANRLRVGKAMGHLATGHGQADFQHGAFEFLAILGLLDRLRFGADHLDVEAARGPRCETAPSRC